MTKRVLLVCLLGVVGCGGGNGGTDAGMTPVDTGSPVDAFAPRGAVMAGTMPADYACSGTAMAPMAGADVMAVLAPQEFLSMAPITNQMVEIYTNNVIGDSCAAPDCMTVTTDMMGHADFTAAGGGWYAYRLPASSMTAQVLAYNRPWPTAAGDEELTAFSMTSVSTVSALLGRSFSMAAGAASGTVVDCDGMGVSNASIRLFVGTMEVVGGPASDMTTPRITGLQGTSPTRTGYTGMEGRFVGANVPPGTYRVEVYGSMTEGADPVLIGCEEGRVVGGGISVFTVGPLRGDYAAGSGCAGLMP